MSRRLVLVSGLLALVIFSVVIAVLARTSPQEPPPEPDPNSTSIAPSRPVQNTMLFAVRNDVGIITDSVVLGTAPTGQQSAASWLSIQPGLSVDINTVGTLTLAQRGRAKPQDISANVANQFGITVDGAAILDRLAFAALVDAVGGVTVSGATAIVGPGPDGELKVLVKAGRRQLFGPAAATYVITLNPGEAQEDRMARFDEVFTQVVLKLPGNVDRVRSILGSLGALSRTSLSPEQSSEILLQVQTALTDRAGEFATAPAEVVGIGTEVVGASKQAVYTLNPAASQPVVEKLFRNSILRPGVGDALPRVRVFAAGVSNTSIVATQARFAQNALTMVWGGQQNPRKVSRIYLPGEPSRALGEQLAQILGLPLDSLVVNPARSAGAQAAIRLAPDSTLTRSPPSASGSASAAD